jgi:hypothetical protein
MHGLFPPIFAAQAAVIRVLNATTKQTHHSVQLQPVLLASVLPSGAPAAGDWLGTPMHV